MSDSPDESVTCPDCGYPIFDDSDDFVSGGGFAVHHSVDDGVFVEEHCCPNCGSTLNTNYEYPDDPAIRTDGGRDSRASRVMVDIETLGLERGAAILSIGAVTFDVYGLGDEFYRSVDLESCQDAGLHIDADTLEWWLDQDDAVTGVLTGGESLADVLEAFNEWYPDGAEVWANSPSFDCELLEAAYDAVGLEEPWGFGDERDVRTLRSLPCAVNVETDGNEHDALDDAKRQAVSVSETLQLLEVGKRA